MIRCSVLFVIQNFERSAPAVSGISVHLRLCTYFSPIALTLRLLMSYIYIYGAPILDVSRSHTTTQHSR